MDEAVTLAETFTGLIRDRAPERLDPWLQQAHDSGIVRLRGFAKREGGHLHWHRSDGTGSFGRFRSIRRKHFQSIQQTREPELRSGQARK